MKHKWFLIVIIITFAISANNVNADWRDNLNKFEKKVKNTTERVKRGTQRAKKNWKQRERKCSKCGKIIHMGTKCTRCKAKAARKSAKKFGNRAKHNFSRVKKTWDDGKDKRRNIYNTVKNRYKDTLNKIRDPKTRKQATETINVIIDVRRKIKEAKRKGVYKGFDMIASIPVNGGRTTFGEFATNRLLDKFPQLRRTGLCDNPAETATAFICHEPKFFLNEIDILRKDGRNISVYGAICESSSFDANKTIKYLQIAGAVEGIASAENLGDAVLSIFGAINAAN